MLYFKDLSMKFIKHSTRSEHSKKDWR